MTTLAWSKHRRASADRASSWSLTTRPALEQTRSLIVRHGRRRTNVSTWFSPIDHDTTVAFIEFVAATPAVQPRVGHFTDLVGALAAVCDFRVPQPRRPTGPMFHSGERTIQILRTLDVVWARRFCGYPVEGEPRPTAEDVIDALLPRAPRWIQLTPPAQLRKEVQAHLDIGAWPFPRLFP